jgi:hypothetical protein
MTIFKNSMLVLSLMCIVSVGCDTKPRQPAVPPTAQNKVEFDQRLLQECPDLPKAKSARDKDIKENGRQIIAFYKECKDLKAAENQEVKKAFNLP